eukprot:404616_1
MSVSFLMILIIAAFKLNECKWTGEHMKSCSECCDPDDECKYGCEVDCGAIVREACKEFESATGDTLIFALDSFKKANGSIDQFEQILNATLFQYFAQISEECENAAWKQCYFVPIIIILMIITLIV